MVVERSENIAVLKAEDAAIYAPAQERSRKAMDRILKALEVLLSEKSFDRITIQELANRSKTSTSSIYARFRDKQALILGIHLRLREQALECLDELVDPERWAGEPTAKIVTGIVPSCVKFYRKHGTLIRAALTVDDAEIRERQASVLRMAEKKICALLPANSPAQVNAVEVAVDFSVSMFASVMYSSLIFGEIGMGRRPMSDRQLSRYLIRAITAVLEQAQAKK